MWSVRCLLIVQVTWFFFILFASGNDSWGSLGALQKKEHNSNRTETIKPQHPTYQQPLYLPTTLGNLNNTGHAS